MSRSQSYKKRNLALQKSKLVLNSLTVHYLNYRKCEYALLFLKDSDVT